MSVLSSTSIQKIYDDRSWRWNEQLKVVSSEKLAKSIRDIVENGGENSDRLWKFSGKLLSELTVREYGKKHKKELDDFRKTIVSKTNDAVVGPSYNVEAAGIKESSLLSHGNKHKVVHPYSQSPEVKAIVKKWENSKSDKSLNRYVATRLSPKEKEALYATRVKYLAPPEYKHYRVTFDDKGKIKIGGKKAPDGGYIFALSIDGKELLAGSKKKGEFHHSSFFAGEPVQSVGNLHIRDRKIVQVTLSSGHYHPTKEQGENLRNYLSDPSQLGSKLANKLPIKAHS